jgi:ubiquinol-cytochrome c reductase cytochrome b subunit
LGGVLAMFAAILILFFLPFFGEFECKSSKLYVESQFFYWLFVSNVILLGYLGACVVEQPFIIVSQLASIFYFAYFLIIIPFLSNVERSSKMIDFKTLN